MLVYRQGDGTLVVELGRWEARTFAYELNESAGLRLLESIVVDVARPLNEDEGHEE